MKFVKTTVAVALMGAVFGVSAAEVHVAVAANFTAPAKDLAPMFEKKTGHKLVLSFGSTGMFYGQIKNGAEYDVLLAADAKTPAKALKEGYGVAGTSFTYAVGKLVLWSSDAGKIKDGAKLLASGDFNKCSVANPKLAPYGQAAYETLTSLKLLDKVSPKFVEGDNIGKAFNFVKTANADIGFVALSQVYKNGKLTGGSGWIVPADMYGKIAQDAVLLKQGKNQDAAREFLEFLKGPEAAKVKSDYGYGDK
jgi:molybdate ABC transporter, periplasmic molybdate-binding protein